MFTNFKKIASYVAIIAFFFYILEIQDILINNFILNAFNDFKLDLNLFLTNNLNKYHPFFFFACLALIIFNQFVLLQIFTNTYSFFLDNFFINFFYKNFYKSFFLSSTAVFLGA